MRGPALVKIATWNVNSIKARLHHVVDWLQTEQPDILCLQEIKCIDDGFPCDALADIGYDIAVCGQKSYNGVAILSRTPLEDVTRCLAGDADDVQARYLEAVTRVDERMVRVASIYLPNGNPADSDKFRYKLDWMGRLATRARELLALEEPAVLAGDYNVIPADEDVYDPEAWRSDALARPEVRSKFREILNLGYTEAYRALHRETGRYTFWDYQAGAWQRDHGFRIDHLLLSPEAADRLVIAGVDKAYRGREKASDHTPVWVELAE